VPVTKLFCKSKQSKDETSSKGITVPLAPLVHAELLYIAKNAGLTGVKTLPELSIV
jgi:hypothetical protein